MKLDEKIWDEVDAIVPSWMSKNEANFLVENTEGGTYVEIGVAFGKSLRIIRNHFPEMSVTGIDKINHGVQQKVPFAKVILGDANEIVKDFTDESIDTLFIDGDHTYNGCMKDFIMWYPKVKKGGSIIFHDYQRDNNHIGVTHCVHAIKPLLQDFKSISYICAGKKPN